MTDGDHALRTLTVESSMPPWVVDELRLDLLDVGYEAVYRRPEEERFGFAPGAVLAVTVAEPLTADAASALARFVAASIRKYWAHREMTPRRNIRLFGPGQELLAEVEMDEGP